MGIEIEKSDLMKFRNKLSKAIKTNNSLLCVGLDVDNTRIPPENIFEFNKTVINSTQQHCSAYKINLSFYESYGSHGYKAMEKTIEYIRTNAPDKLLIADGKRGDIPSTMIKIGIAHFETWEFDCTTANIWGGFESIEPLLQYPGKGVFIWAKSSNKGSQDIQDIKSNSNKKNYELIIEQSIKHNLSANIGLVVGATSPNDLYLVRSISDDIPILCPGIGAQSGNLSECLKNGIGNKSSNLLINASRSIIYAQGAIKNIDNIELAAKDVNSRINSVLKKYKSD